MHFVTVCSGGTDKNAPDKGGRCHFFGPEKAALKKVAKPDIDDDHQHGNAQEKTTDDQVEILKDRLGCYRHGFTNSGAWE